MGTINPPSTTCGINAMGASAIEASLLVTRVLTKRPSATEFIAVAINVPRPTKNAGSPPRNPSAKNTIARSTVHCTTQNS